MNRIRSTKTQTSVNKFTTLSMLTILFILATPSTQANPTVQAPVVTADAMRGLQNDQACRDAAKEIVETEKRMNKVCGDAGYGEAVNCAVRELNCAVEAGDSDSSWSQTITTVANAATGLNLSMPASGGRKISDKCATHSSKDYASERKNSQKDLDDAKKDLSKLTEDQAEIQAEYDERIDKLMQDISEANEQLTQTKSDLDAEERKDITDFQAAQKETARQIRENQSKEIQIRARLTNALREHTNALSQLTTEASKYKCTTEYNKVIKELQGKSSSSSNHIRKGKQIKATALDSFNRCMEGFQGARVQASDRYKTEKESITKELDNLDAENADLEDNLRLGASNLEQIKKSVLDRKNAAEKKVSDLLTRTQAQMESAKQELSTRLQSIQKQQQDLQEKINRISSNLATMAAPRNGAELTYNEANSKISNEAGNLASAIDSCKNTCGSDSSSKCSSKTLKALEDAQRRGKSSSGRTKATK